MSPADVSPAALTWEGAHAYEYALLRVVPRIERGEAINAGVLLYCRSLDYLGAQVHLDRARLAALDAGADADAISRVLSSLAALCAEDTGAARHAGPAGEEDRGRRFRRLTAPRSTIVQAGPVHTGLSPDPAAELPRLLRALVHPVR